MGYTKSQIVSFISGTATASPVLSTTGTNASGRTYNNFDHTNWAWNPFGTTDSSNLTYTDNPADAGTFQQRPYHPISAIPGITATTPVFTFNQVMTRKLAFRTKISGEFTLTFKILAGGNTINSTETDKIRNSSGGTFFGHPNGNWTLLSGATTKHNVKVAYNTSSFLSGTGTWVAVRSLHAFPATGKDFGTQQFTTISVTATLPAEAFVGIIQETNSSHHASSCRWAIADVQLTYINPSVIAGYRTVSVSEFATHWNEMQCFLNGNITSSDISTTPWVETYHMKPIRFFGSPAPRIEAISGDIHYRREKVTSHLYFGQGEDFMPISGLASTIHVAPPFLDESVMCIVKCCFFAEESGNRFEETPEGNDLCDFGLFVVRGNGNIQQIPGTNRTLYQEQDGEFYGNKNISIISSVRLSVGVNHIYVGVRFASDKFGRTRAKISRKSFVIDVKYL